MDILKVLKQELNSEQYDAAIDPAAEILCLACAGSGKSRTLAFRVARLIGQGAPPESIVAFTFTVKAAESIRRRVAYALLKSGIDPTAISSMYIGTIHAYCQRILGDADPIYRQFDVLDENTLKLYLISRYAKFGLQKFRNRAIANSYFKTIDQIAGAWKTANDELVDLNDIKAEDRQLGELLIQIRNSMQEDQFVDYSNIIRSAVELMESNAMDSIDSLRQVRHLLVDEYQDVNPSQEELIRLMRSNGETLFVVGDDDQAIYGWRGADISNILEFDDKYPDCAIHTLSRNFRSTVPIVKATSAFAANTLGPSRREKFPRAEHNARPQELRVKWFDTRREEAAWVASRIESLIGRAYRESGGTRGLTPGDFAILMRSTRTSEQDGSRRHTAFTNALHAIGIDYSLEAGGGPFVSLQARTIRATFGLLRNSPLRRGSVIRHFNEFVRPAFPNADQTEVIRVLTHWTQLIHRPLGTTRIRLYPQDLVHSLLKAFCVADSDFDEATMRSLALFSQMISDVESVYVSVDSRGRFEEVLNYLDNVGEYGYDISTDDLISRPNAVTVSTVHKMKGLEFPCVFVVDAESHRFPRRRSGYKGWLPNGTVSEALARGAYQNTFNEESRLFYTACTRAERFLYVTGSAQLPNAKRLAGQSQFALRLEEANTSEALSDGDVANLAATAQRRRLEDADYPTSYTEIKDYLRCPKSFQFRHRYGFNPTIPELFGFGRTVHTSIQKLHQLFHGKAPDTDDICQIVHDTFHLKHVPPSGNPIDNPGPYERALDAAVEVSSNYVNSYGDDFSRRRQLEVTFEVPAARCVISGSIDLVLHQDSAGNVEAVDLVDFKSVSRLESGSLASQIEWTELSLQVQLYAFAAEAVLGKNARTGNVHFLKENKRVSIPISGNAVGAAIANVEWAVQGILAGDFPMRPEPIKCGMCDFQSICSMSPEEFVAPHEVPPPLHLPDRMERVLAFSQFAGEPLN